MSSNWLIASLRYDLKPTLDNFIRFRFVHFKFCVRKNPAINAAIYLDNLADEIKKKLNNFKNTSKTTLILTAVQKALTDKDLLKKMIALFEKTDIGNEDIHAVFDNKKLRSDTKGDEEVKTNLNIASRTYLIATHLHLELNNREDDYEVLIRNTKELTAFITERFGATKLSPRIADMKTFSYKKILQGRNNDGAKGQLKPQLKQIIDNPDLFGLDISEFAARLMKDYFDESL